MEERGERKVKARSVPSVHLQQMFPEERCPAGSAHSSLQADLDSDDPCTKFSRKPGVVLSCAQKTLNLQSLGFHFIQRGCDFMDEALAVISCAVSSRETSLVTCGLQLGT